MVKLYLSSGVSYQDLALQEKINHPTQICKWVNDFNIAGLDALRPKKKGHRKSLKPNDNENTAQSFSEISPVDIRAEHVKQLEDELLKLRIENAYLKELRRLRLKEETLLKKATRIIHNLRKDFKLKDILAVISFPKATYMYWKKDLIERRLVRNCYDNLVIEHFFGIMKQKIYYGNVYYSYDELKEAIDKCIEIIHRVL